MSFFDEASTVMSDPTSWRWLTDALRTERLTPTGVAPPKKGVAVTATELRALAAPVAFDPKLAFRHRALLQITAVAVAAIDGGGGDVAATEQRRRTALACITRDAAAAAAARIDQGAAAAAAAQALVSCLKAGLRRSHTCHVIHHILTLVSWSVRHILNSVSGLVSNIWSRIPFDQ
jgi:hypothetical protein